MPEIKTYREALREAIVHELDRDAAAQQPRQPGARGAGGHPEQLPRAQASRRIGDLILNHNR
jgi:hypothetical protein